MEKFERGVNFVARVPKEIYQRDLDLRLPPDELMAGESVVLRRKSGYDDPYALDIFSDILRVKANPTLILTDVKLKLYAKDLPKSRTVQLSDDGMVIVFSEGHPFEIGYFLATVQDFDYELEELIEHPLPRQTSWLPKH